ncbi:ABC transporter substrate-binding protein [Variovorax sp. UC122_21]
MFYSATHNSPLNKAAVNALAEVTPKAIPTVQLANAFDGLHVIYHMVKATDGKRDGPKAMAAAKGFSWESPRGPVKIDPASREFVQNVYMRVVEKDAAGRFVNREFRTFEMQPDYGRIQNATK